MQATVRLTLVYGPWPMIELPETQRELRGHDFYPSDIDTLPRLYSTESVKVADKVIVAHYFVGRCDWWFAEIQSDGMAFGYACLGDPQMAEWGYSHLPELEAIAVHGLFVVERDLNWQPTPFRDISHACVDR